jgi:DICT domain-containing protein
MSLTELIAGVEADERTLVVYNAEDAVEELRARFADRNVVVEADRTDTRTDRFVVMVSNDGEILTAVGVDRLLEEPETKAPGAESDPHRPILDRLDETTFTSYGRREMLAASREIEDRAWRIGRGELHSGFQRLSVFETQLDVYTRLSERETLTVHAYGTPDTSVPEQESFVVHPERSEEIGRSWFVAYDGAGVDENKCALLAEERAPDSFYGFWTYDPDTVDYVLDHLSSSYLQPDVGSSPDERSRK